MVTAVSLRDAVLPFVDFPQMVWATDGGEIAFNQQAISYLGCQELEKFSSKYQELIPILASNSGSDWHHICRLEGRDGNHRWHRLIGQNPSGWWLITAQDIDEFKRINDSRNLLVNQQVHLEKALEQRDIFLSVCSHELKTPVTSLKLLTQLTVRQIEKDQFVVEKTNIHKVMKKFAGQVDRLSALIEDMLDVSRIESGRLYFKKEKFNLSQLLFLVYESCSVHFQELNIPLTSHLEPNLRVIGDQVRIEQVVVNLLNNAIKYGKMKEVTLRLLQEKGFAIIEVEDQGIGILPEHFETIFRRFERVHADGNVTGLGLGLYISRTIVEDHQGQIRVRSVPGQGSVFSIYLPLADY